MPSTTASSPRDKPVIFAYHGYPWLIHRLTYKRAGHDQLHVHGFLERGTTTTPFDMVMLNGLDRYTLAVDVIDRAGLAESHAAVRQELTDARDRAKAYTREHGIDIPEVADWVWPGVPAPERARWQPAQQSRSPAGATPVRKYSLTGPSTHGLPLLYWLCPSASTEISTPDSSISARSTDCW